jgi:hypothetical protein
VIDLLDLIEDDAAGLSYSEQPHNESYNNQEPQQLPVRARKIEDVMVLDSLGGIASGLLCLLLLLASIGSRRPCWRAGWGSGRRLSRAARVGLVAQILALCRLARHDGVVGDRFLSIGLVGCSYVERRDSSKIAESSYVSSLFKAPK